MVLTISLPISKIAIGLKSLFFEFGKQRAQFAGEIENLVRELGGDPQNSGSTAGALHRGWIDIKSVVTGKDNGAILNGAQRGERMRRKKHVRDAPGENLPANVVSVVQSQYPQVQAAHDKVRDLRDSVNKQS